MMESTTNGVRESLEFTCQSWLVPLILTTPGLQVVPAKLSYRPGCLICTDCLFRGRPTSNIVALVHTSPSNETTFILSLFFRAFLLRLLSHPKTLLKIRQNEILLRFTINVRINFNHYNETVTICLKYYGILINNDL